MKLRWTSRALSDLARLHEFLAPVHPQAAARAVQTLTRAPEVLLRHPRLGEQLFEFQPQEVRRLIIKQYELRYEIKDEVIYVLRLWHTKEDR